MRFLRALPPLRRTGYDPFILHALVLSSRRLTISDMFVRNENSNSRVIPTRISLPEDLFLSVAGYSFSRQIFVGISDAERARTYENVIQNERNKGDREKKIRQIKRKRDREAEEEDEERRQKGRILAGPKIERPTFLAMSSVRDSDECIFIPFNDHERMMSE